MTKLKRIRKAGFLFAIIFINISCDQISEKVAQENLNFGDKISYLNGSFKLMYAENEGAMLGFGTDLNPILKSIFLVVLPVSALILLIGYTFFSKKIGFGNAIAFSFLLGGGVSNVFDRVVDGKVIDFLHLSYGTFHTGIFNMVDMSIMFGLFSMVILQFLHKKKHDEFLNHHASLK